jgi:fumarate reductase subunit D
MLGVLAGFGLAAATGLNAYLPLLIVGLLARYTDLIALAAPWDALTHPVVLVVIGVLLAIEVTVDKIPAVDTVNDVIQTLFRPAAGAVLFAASGNVISHVSPVLAMVCGLLIAGGVHTAKAAARPAVTAGTLGTGNPVVSLAEDAVSGVTTVVAVVAPVLIMLLVLLAVWLFIRWYHRRNARN